MGIRKKNLKYNGLFFGNENLVENVLNCHENNVMKQNFIHILKAGLIFFKQNINRMLLY